MSEEDFEKSSIPNEHIYKIQLIVYPWARLGILYTMREGKVNDLNIT